MVRAVVLIPLLLAAVPSIQEKKTPVSFKAKGRLVCLLEEMKEGFQAEVPPIHKHVVGFKVKGKLRAGGFRYYTIIQTALSDALILDKRFWGRDLRLLGRVFPDSALLDVSRFQWFKEGKLLDVYYWCEVCSIKGVDPGPCACCQGKVDLREAPAEAGD